MKESVLYAILISILLFFFGVVADAATINVSMQNFSFQPSAVTVNVGDTVTWTNNESSIYGGVFHTATSGSGCAADGTWDSGPLSFGQSFSMTFMRPGRFAYFCSFHCLSNNMTGTVTVNAAASSIPVPTFPFITTFQPVASPALNTDPAQAQPIGVGNVQGGTLSLQIGLAQFAGPVDVYFLVYVPSIDPVNIYQLTPMNTLQPIAMGLAPLIPNTQGPVGEALLGNIPIPLLPNGQYSFAVLVTPAGDTSLSSFDLWITSLSL